MHIYIYAHTCIRTCVCICNTYNAQYIRNSIEYIYIYIHMYVCIYIYINLYIFKHAHDNIYHPLYIYICYNVREYISPSLSVSLSLCPTGCILAWMSRLKANCNVKPIGTTILGGPCRTLEPFPIHQESTLLNELPCCRTSASCFCSL